MHDEIYIKINIKIFANVTFMYRYICIIIFDQL